MFQSKLFSKTQKTISSDEKSINAILLIRAGFINKLSSGVFSYLPLGLRVIKNIERIVREEMDKIGAQEILMPALHFKENWQKSGRWDTKEMFKIDDKYGLGWTHEEIITPLIKNFINYTSKDGPMVYQIQTKFRNEPRAKSGLLRTKEFIMKDLYSFHYESGEIMTKFYEEVKQSYWNIFQRCGIKNKTFFTLASGGTFSEFSHEFQTITDAGEDEIYICEKCDLAINKEIKGSYSKCPECGGTRFKIKKAIEVGNIFQLDNNYSKIFNLVNDKSEYLKMGCYGLGISRLMGAVVEVFNDKNGIVWPREIAPFMFHILELDSNDKNISKMGKKIYNELNLIKKEALLDDRKNKSAGEKLVESDLLGIPYKVIISKRNLEKDVIEVKERATGKMQYLKPIEIKKFYKSKLC